MNRLIVFVCLLFATAPAAFASCGQTANFAGCSGTNGTATYNKNSGAANIIRRKVAVIIIPRRAATIMVLHQVRARLAGAAIARPRPSSKDAPT
jgi:hypothetical protein